MPPEAATHAAQEYLVVQDKAAFRAATPVRLKFISPADPAARWTGAHGGQAFFDYTGNHPIDLDHAIFVDVEATTATRGHRRKTHDRAFARAFRTLSG